MSSAVLWNSAHHLSMESCLSNQDTQQESTQEDDEERQHSEILGKKSDLI